MTYRVRLPGTSGELTFKSRDEAQEVLGTDGTACRSPSRARRGSWGRDGSGDVRRLRA